MYIKKLSGFFWFIVHPRQEPFPSVRAKLIYTVVGPRGRSEHCTRMQQKTVPALKNSQSTCARNGRCSKAQ